MSHRAGAPFAISRRLRRSRPTRWLRSIRTTTRTRVGVQSHHSPMVGRDVPSRRRAVRNLAAPSEKSPYPLVAVNTHHYQNPGGGTVSSLPDGRARCPHRAGAPFALSRSLRRSRPTRWLRSIRTTTRTRVVVRFHHSPMVGRDVPSRRRTVRDLAAPSEKSPYPLVAVNTHH